MPTSSPPPPPHLPPNLTSKHYRTEISITVTLNLCNFHCSHQRRRSMHPPQSSPLPEPCLDLPDLCTCRWTGCHQSRSRGSRLSPPRNECLNCRARPASRSRSRTENIATGAPTHPWCSSGSSRTRPRARACRRTRGPVRPDM